jgi:hypothetical protein
VSVATPEVKGTRNQDISNYQGKANQMVMQFNRVMHLK